MAEQEMGAFRSVDHSHDPKWLIAMMDELDETPQVREARDLMRRALNPKSGDSMLDLGCGTGFLAREFAKLVGPNGKVIGIDGSDGMIAEARRRSLGLNLPVEFRVGNASQLPFDDNTFAGCTAERLCQHVNTPARVISELSRVVHRGARVVVSDADWGSATLNAANKRVARRVLDYYCDSIENGWMGRQHKGLFKDAGLESIEVHPQVWVHHTFADLDAWGFTSTLDRAVSEKVVSEEEGRELLDSLLVADRSGKFFYSMTGFVVSGRKS